MARPKRICSIPDCGKHHYGHGFCVAHFERWKKHGDPLGGRVPNGEGMQFLRNAVFQFDSVEHCLEWPYFCDGKGYGRVRLNGKTVAAHRLSCEHLHGPAPSPRHEAAHNCGNRRCVNPHHIRWATTKENNADKLIHGRENIGERNGQSKLTETQVYEIRHLLKTGRLPQKEIAAKYHVSKGCITDINQRKRWAWLP